MTLTEQLIIISDLWCRGAGRSRSRVSTLVFGDGSRLDGIVAGKDLNTRSWERAMAWFSANWPEGLAWPEGVERPQAVTGDDQRPAATSLDQRPDPSPASPRAKADVAPAEAAP